MPQNEITETQERIRELKSALSNIIVQHNLVLDTYMRFNIDPNPSTAWNLKVLQDRLSVELDYERVELCKMRGE